MDVNYKPGTLLPETFDYAEGDYVTIIVHFWTVKHEEETLYYHGTITGIDEDREGFWAVLDDDKEREEFFAFPDLEGVIDGERIPFLAGTTKRSKSDLEKRDV
ncbi:MAG: hypothetical protein ACI35O_16750 [Bacillaceae bacterium]